MVLIGNLAASLGDHPNVDPILAQLTKDLDERVAWSTSRGHVTGRGSLDYDHLVAELRFPGGPIGEKNDPGGHLLEQAKLAGDIGSDGLKSGGILPSEGPGDGIGRWWGGGRNILEAPQGRIDSGSTWLLF